MIGPVEVLLDRVHRLAPIGADDLAAWPAGLITTLEHAGVVVRGETARAVVCEHCAEGCWVEPFVRRLPGVGATLVHPCVGPAEAGLLRFAPDRLHTWRLDPAGLAGLVSTGLGLVGAIEERAPGVWWLGERRQGGRRDVFIAVGLEDHHDRGEAALLDGVRGLAPILLAASDVRVEDASVVPLIAVLAVEDAGVVIDRERFDALVQPPRAKRAGVTPFALPRDARWERLSLEVIDDSQVRIRYGEREETRSYIELGFMDGRSKATDPRPSELWALFVLFAKQDGSIAWGTGPATAKLRDRVRDLRRKLAEVFPIAEGSPIRDYSETKAYETSFTLRRRR